MNAIHARSQLRYWPTTERDRDVILSRHSDLSRSVPVDARGVSSMRRVPRQKSSRRGSSESRCSGVFSGCQRRGINAAVEEMTARRIVVHLRLRQPGLRARSASINCMLLLDVHILVVGRARPRAAESRSCLDVEERRPLLVHLRLFAGEPPNRFCGSISCR